MKTHELVGCPVNRDKVDDVPDNIDVRPIDTIILELLLLEELLGHFFVPLCVAIHRLHVGDKRMPAECAVLVVLFTLVEHEHESIPARERLHILRVGLYELARVCEDVANTSERVEHLRHGLRDGALKRVLVYEAKLREVLVCRCRNKEREERVDRVRRVVPREVAEEELGQRRTEGAVVGVTNAVLEAPARECLGSVVRSEEAIPANEVDRVREDCARHCVPTADARTRAESHAVFRLQTWVELQVVDVPVQLTCGGSNAGSSRPLLEGREALEAEELAKLVHRAHTPFSSLFDAQNFDNPEASRRSTRAVSTGDLLSRVLQDLREVVVLERTVLLALKADED